MRLKNLECFVSWGLQQNLCWSDSVSIKDVHRRLKLTTDFFFKLFELTILLVNISISRKKNMLTVVSRESIYKGLDNKIKVLSIFNSSDDRCFSNLKST